MPAATIQVHRITKPKATGVRQSESDNPQAVSKYPDSPKAAVAAEADFAHRNIQPALKPKGAFQ